MTHTTRRVARASLMALWLATAGISMMEIHGEGARLLEQTAIPASWYTAVIGSGAALDAAMGLALWRWHRPMVYALAGLHLLFMTIAATLLLPSLWLDPLGSLSKNAPIAALLWVLHEDARA